MNEKLTVYKILNKLTGKYYIGSSVNFEVRKFEHIGMLRNKRHHNKFLQYDWNKYGESQFDFFPIKQGFSNVEQMILSTIKTILFRKERDRRKAKTLQESTLILQKKQGVKRKKGAYARSKHLTTPTL